MGIHVLPWHCLGKQAWIRTHFLLSGHCHDVINMQSITDSLCYSWMQAFPFSFSVNRNIWTFKSVLWEEVKWWQEQKTEKQEIAGKSECDWCEKKRRIEKWFSLLASFYETLILSGSCGWIDIPRCQILQRKRKHILFSLVWALICVLFKLLETCRSDNHLIWSKQKKTSLNDSCHSICIFESGMTGSWLLFNCAVITRSIFIAGYQPSLCTTHSCVQQVPTCALGFYRKAFLGKGWIKYWCRKRIACPRKS